MAVRMVRLFADKVRARMIENAEKGPSDLRQQNAAENAYLGEMARLGLYTETD